MGNSPAQKSAATPRKKVTATTILEQKNKTKLTSVTAYDYSIARLVDTAGVDIILVGDSLGMVMLGHSDTTRVTLDDMVHHTAAVARAKPRQLIVGDLEEVLPELVRGGLVGVEPGPGAGGLAQFRAVGGLEQWP